MKGCTITMLANELGLEYQRLMLRALCCLVVVAACGTDGIPPPPDSTSGVDAEAVYRDNCGRCHGPAGEGTSKGPQIQSPVHAYATYVVRNGRGSEMGFSEMMPAFSSMDIADLEPVLTWLDRAPHPTDGATLYARYCGNCHGADAHGGRVGEDVVHEAQEEGDEVREKVREGHGGANYGARTKYMPAWGASELSDDEIAMITAFLRSLPPGPGDGDDDDDDD